MLKEQNLTVIRNHDKMYLSENRKHQPKEYFKFISSKAKEHINKYKAPKLLDIGCATGDFLFYLNSQYPNATITGIDVMDELLDRAKKEVEDCTFINGNICKEETLPQNKYNAVFMNGVHSIFDDIGLWLDNAISLVEKNGKLFIFGIFNPADIDVLVKSKYSEQHPDDPWESGWNCFSKKSFQNYLERNGISSYNFYEFNIDIDIPKTPNDPLKSWTFMYNNNTRGVINGTMILHQFYLLEVTI